MVPSLQELEGTASMKVEQLQGENQALKEARSESSEAAHALYRAQIEGMEAELEVLRNFKDKAEAALAWVHQHRNQLCCHWEGRIDDMA